MVSHDRRMMAINVKKMIKWQEKTNEKKTQKTTNMKKKSHENMFVQRRAQRQTLQHLKCKTADWFYLLNAVYSQTREKKCSGEHQERLTVATNKTGKITIHPFWTCTHNLSSSLWALNHDYVFNNCAQHTQSHTGRE